jgi:hypothetical protein
MGNAHPAWKMVDLVEKLCKTGRGMKNKILCGVLGCFGIFCWWVGPVMAANWNPLPDTGQTKCYNNTVEIPCPAQGQPFYGQDAQYHGPAPSYTDNGNGTVTDNNTGLVWMKHTADTNNDGSIDSGDELPWQDAVDYCNALGSGWRLPERIELRSIVDYGRHYLAINPVFQCESSSYWSATTYANYTYNAWYIYFDFGDDHNSYKANSYYVRCVRAGL